jgi:DNA helicase IV
MLGPKVDASGQVDEADEIRTYGHIVIDEVQDLTPMQLMMATRRSLNGSMTIVGDIAQATGPLAPSTWDDVLAYLPDRRPPRQVGLSVGYRIPAQIMDVAVRVMLAATPGLRPPQSVRVGDSLPRVVAHADLFETMVAEVVEMTESLPIGSVGVIVPDAMTTDVSAALDAAGLAHGRAAFGLDDRLTVVPTSVMKGLELDGIVVVEPALIADEAPNGLRSLYVALTRATQRLTIVHRLALPEMLRS